MGSGRDAVSAAASAMVEQGCSSVMQKHAGSTKLSDNDRKAVNGLMCNSLTFATEAIASGLVTPVDVGKHLVQKGINLAKLTVDQQNYCNLLKAEIALHSGILAGVAATTFVAASAGGKAGIVAGGLYGGMAGPKGVIVGAVGGLAVGAGVPLALGSWEMFKSVAEITDLAIDYHSQCGPMATQAATPRSPAVAAP